MKNTTTTKDQGEDVRQWLPLADRLGARFARRYGQLVEADDCQQEARLALWQAIGRLRSDDDSTRAEREAYLRLCIEGGLRKYLRDRAALVRVPWRARARGEAEAHWTHSSLDAPLPDGGCLLDNVAAPEHQGQEADQWSAATDALLETLPAVEAATLRLRVLEGQSVRAAAAELGCSVAAVCRRERRGLERLRAAA